MAIKKSTGVTPTEELLSELCDKTFLRLWSYANPHKEDRKELCDLIAVFEDHVFIFFDRESRKFDGSDIDVLLTWSRWKREAIDKQIQTAKGAEKYIKSGRPVFIDQENNVPFPLKITPEMKIHKIIVAHGAQEACEAFSEDNVYGSLAVSYGSGSGFPPFPFSVALDSKDLIHVLDSHNLEILFGELDTFFDLVAYLEEKERAIGHFGSLAYCGEEDLIAHYLFNYDQEKSAYGIGPKDEDIDYCMIGEGEWESFIELDIYARRKAANEVSYYWDHLIQKTGQNALDDVLVGNADLLMGESAIREMAKEPRLFRRALSETMIGATEKFPVGDNGTSRFMSFMPSHYPDKGYVFLQLDHPKFQCTEEEYREKRQAMLEIACGVARNKFPHLNKVVGIAMEPPRLYSTLSEDFILLNCQNWGKEDEEIYRKANEGLKFFHPSTIKRHAAHITDFPSKPDPKGSTGKVGRNERCPCGSGKKYKKCCLP